MDDERALEIAIAAAERGGQLAAARSGDPGFLQWKGERDLLTASTIEVQGQILASLREACPDDVVLAEEGPLDEVLDLAAGRLWIVDPICGTANFAQGIPFFAVSIALRVDGELRVGVVHDPVRGETFAARYGEAATLNGRPINVIPVSLGPEFWQQAWIATDLPPSGPRRTEALRLFDIYAKEVTQQSILGSPALGLAYVAAGRLHAYWNLDAKPWDVAAALVILRSAGALVTDAEGGHWLHSDGSYLAANPASHQWALRAAKFVRQQAREAMQIKTAQ